MIKSLDLRDMGISNKSNKLRVSIIGAIIAALLTIPFWASQYMMMICLLIFLYLAIGQMWNLLAGYSGLVSLGQQIFIGIGGYSLAVLTELYKAPPWTGMLVGGILSVVFALFISVPIFRTRGVFFTIGSWIVAEGLMVFFSNWAYVRYAQGFFITAGYQLTTNDLYYISLGIGFISIAIVYYILRSKLGLGLMAMRDNEEAAEAMGLEIFRTKLICFLVGSFVTGITGAVLYMNIGFIQPYAAFGINWTVAMVFMVIIGGIGTIEGPIIGAIVYVVLQQFLYDYPGISMIILGFIAIIVILIAPKGIVGTFQEKTGFELLSLRRR